MKKTIFSVIFLLCVIATAHAQLQEHDNLLGATIGLWAHNHVPTIGVNYEYQITQAGIGTISLGGILKYYSWTDNYSDGDSRKYTFTTLGVQSNYNFNQIGDGKFVPFIGLVISYNSVNETYTDVTRPRGLLYRYRIYKRCVGLGSGRNEIFLQSIMLQVLYV